MKIDLSDLLDPIQKKSTRVKEKLTCNLPELKTTAAQFIQYDQAADVAKNQAEGLKAVILPAVRREWLTQNHGRPEPVASIVIPVGEEGGLQVSFSAAWSPKGRALETMPPELVRQRVEISIDGDKLPDSSVREFITRLLQLAQEMGVVSAISSKTVTVPIAAFGTLRHQKLTPEANIALEEAGLSTRVAFKAI